MNIHHPETSRHWRKELRNVEYLLKPFEEVEFQSVTGEPLDEGLLKLSGTSHKNQSEYYSWIAASKAPSKIRFVPFPIRKSDRECVAG